jgi:hypothetical protein
MRRTERSSRASLWRGGKSRFQISGWHFLDRVPEGFNLIGPLRARSKGDPQSWPSSLTPLQ